MCRFFSKRVNGCRLSAYVLFGNFFPENLNAFKNSGNIPDVEDFLKKVGAISDFLHMYYM